MNKNKYLALTAVGFFLSGCGTMTKNQAALVGASVCGAMGAGVGAAGVPDPAAARPGEHLR